MPQDPYPHPFIDQVTLTDVLHALSDPLRLSIVQALMPGEEMAWSAFGGSVAPSTLSHQMKVLRNAGLIATRRDGLRCLVALRPDLSIRFPGLLDLVMALAPR